MDLPVQNDVARTRIILNKGRWGEGYLVGCEIKFNAAQQPPKASHLLLVKNSGVADEVTFRADH